MSLNIARIWFGALAGAAILGSAPAYAQDGPSVSFGLTGASDYVWRGVSQSDGDPAVFVSGQVAYNGFYAGAGAENVDFLGASKPSMISGPAGRSKSAA